MFLILGSSGYIGSKIFHFLTKNGRDVIGVSRSEIDYTESQDFEGILRSKNPRFLINAAGYTGKPNVDACELAKADCLDGNAVLTRVLSTSLRRIKYHMGTCFERMYFLWEKTGWRWVDRG